MTNNLTPRLRSAGRSSVSIPISTSTLRWRSTPVGSIWVTSRSPPIQAAIRPPHVGRDPRADSRRSASKAPAAMAWALRVRSAERGHRVVEVNRADRRLRRRRRQVRPDRRRGRRPIGAGGPSDRDAKDRGWCRRDDPAAQSRAGYRREGAHRGDEHAEADQRQRAVCGARNPSTASPLSACWRPVQPSGQVALTRPPPPQSTPCGRWPDAGSPSPRKSPHTTGTSRDSRPRRRPPSGRGSGWAPTARPSF